MKAAKLSAKLQDHPEYTDFSKDEKTFALMPCMHAEDLELQKRCVEGFTKLGFNIKFAQDHCDIVEQFGRFPHRNEILERTSTEEEKAWIKMNNETKKYPFAIIAKK